MLDILSSSNMTLHHFPVPPNYFLHPLWCLEPYGSVSQTGIKMHGILNRDLHLKGKSSPRLGSIRLRESDRICPVCTVCDNLSVLLVSLSQRVLVFCHLDWSSTSSPRLSLSGHHEQHTLGSKITLLFTHTHTHAPSFIKLTANKDREGWGGCMSPIP